MELPPCHRGILNETKKTRAELKVTTNKTGVDIHASHTEKTSKRSRKRVICHKKTASVGQRTFHMLPQTLLKFSHKYKIINAM